MRIIILFLLGLSIIFAGCTQTEGEAIRFAVDDSNKLADDSNAKSSDSKIGKEDPKSKVPSIGSGTSIAGVASSAADGWTYEVAQYDNKYTGVKKGDFSYKNYNNKQVKVGHDTNGNGEVDEGELYPSDDHGNVLHPDGNIRNPLGDIVGNDKKGNNQIDPEDYKDGYDPAVWLPVINDCGLVVYLLGPFDELTYVIDEDSGRKGWQYKGSDGEPREGPEDTNGNGQLDLEEFFEINR